MSELLSKVNLNNQQQQVAEWFVSLRNKIRNVFEAIEEDYAQEKQLVAGKFEITSWKHEQEGGGEISLMKGNVFEKVGVNISIVKGEFNEVMRKEVPGANENPAFFATGVSLVAHMHNPLVPAVHMNTRFINTTKNWFGGGADLTPTFEFTVDTEDFHQAFKECCDKFDPDYYAKFKKWCDEYFYLPHRKEARGVGGIFYDYVNSSNFEHDFAFTQQVGETFYKIYDLIVRRNMFKSYTEEQKYRQLVKRGRYVEFNLLYDRGTKFGLMTGGNVDAILMSMPPQVIWE
ncbi:oxygen-dependent coproporphyrinogen oxidase [Rickettsiales endosymbiont of Stachyamoeba lipophora]|uniref:oxygen-dependent coproporphyrinogen oxidase n=1 Tax=Rickettsiales endosymbiont of Stachyamoeba lipophora TaxID=2486578 RepID=UPI000F6511FF|nr:oxygen-dependent coproporphyrinogen oxidase [Rickettsiales endosymbiont of Stachyamoeba lipophora]AZL15032.1 oxygen-dependent coproporphyrinogen oxidase [Rickettsiales endosymbiont of Stachyamoeba lipophora]